MSKKHLVLLRHGQAENNFTSDKSRHLVPYGKTQIKQTWAKIKPFLHVDICLVSSATRTRETLQVIQNENPNLDTSLLDSLYLGSEDDYLLALAGCDEEASTCLLIGHNPTISILASNLSNQYINFDTGDALVLEGTGEWANMAEISWSIVKTANN